MTTQTEVLSRSQFGSLIGGCLVLLEMHGFNLIALTKARRAGDPAEQLEDIFEHEIFCMIGVDVEPRAQGRGDVPPKIKSTATGKELDQITLECALHFNKQGLALHHNEVLNSLRLAIQEVIQAMGYELPERDRPNQLWGCYSFWETVAKQAGVSRVEIQSTRKYYAEHYPKYFEI